MLQLKLTRSLITTGRSRVRLKSTKGTITDPQAAFRDPNSPPGSAPPDEISNIRHHASGEVGKAYQKLLDNGFDPLSFWEQRICWGDQDSYQHVNNARMARFFESSRVQWMTSIGEELGGPQKGLDMLKGRGVAHILKSIEIQFRRPVTYPDTVLVGYRPNIPSELEDRMVLLVTAKAYSVQQQAFVAIANEVLVWYDYDKLKKCDPGDRIWDIVRNRIRVSRDGR